MQQKMLKESLLMWQNEEDLDLLRCMSNMFYEQ